ncbi:MAG: S8 family serine peptidase [Bdellovibrionales bacterium]|nr:S8 family serine peptidase [Bdellovibrionales bacterium]
MNWGLKAISAEVAWLEGAADKSVIVAIIDTGADINHPNLSKNIWTNPGETGVAPDGSDKASNGIDDDGNGFVDDAHGWDFVSNSPALMDEHGHGTHIAGIIGAAPFDGPGASGVAPGVSLMILKYYDTETAGLDNLANTVRAIRYAVDNGAKIINYSGGGILRNRLEEEALRYAAENGVLVVAAAGNEGVNSDFFPFYPADYDLPNIISVGAVDRGGELLAVSNYGLGSVDLVAPGKNIFSTLPQGRYGYMTGTSQATAFVSGVAALMMAHDARYRDPATLRAQLLSSGRSLTSLRGKIGSGQLLNAALALQPTKLEISETNNGRRPAQDVN